MDSIETRQAVAKQETERIPLFDDFRFADLVFSEPTGVDAEGTSMGAEVVVRLRDGEDTFDLRVDRSLREQTDDKSFFLQLGMTISVDGEELIGGEFGISRDLSTGGLVTQSNILRLAAHDDTRLAGKNLGARLCGKLLDYLETLPDQHGISFVDRVVRGPYEGLSVEKWDELFAPVLEAKGYRFERDEEEQEDVWKKTYSPSAS